MISLIVAVDNNNCIGKDNNLMWHLSKDLAFFKKTTLNTSVVMGRKTFESIGKALPNRTNIVMSRDDTYKAEGCHVVTSVNDALKVATESGHHNIVVIGGEEIYNIMRVFCSKLYVTYVDTEIDGDTFVELGDLSVYKRITIHEHKKDERNDHDFKIVEYSCY